MLLRPNRNFFWQYTGANFLYRSSKLKKYQPDVEQLYRKHKFHYVWYDHNGVNEFANLLHNKLNNLREEGVKTPFP
jgi:hypothetical protein